LLLEVGLLKLELLDLGLVILVFLVLNTIFLLPFFDFLLQSVFSFFGRALHILTLFLKLVLKVTDPSIKGVFKAFTLGVLLESQFPKAFFIVILEFFQAAFSIAREIISLLLAFTVNLGLFSLVVVNEHLHFAFKFLHDVATFIPKHTDLIFQVLDLSLKLGFLSLVARSLILLFFLELGDLSF